VDVHVLDGDFPSALTAVAIKVRFGLQSFYAGCLIPLDLGHVMQNHVQ
jgi:hypothetical protein